MATTETIIGQLPNGRLIIYWNNAGPASYAAGGFNVTINAFRKVIEQVIEISNDGGYRVEPQEARNTISGTTMTLVPHFEAFACPGSYSGTTPSCPTGFTPNVGVSLSAVTFGGIVTGY